MKALIIVTDSEAVPVFERVLAEEREGFTVVPAIIGRGRSGLKAGDRVVVEGVQKVRPGVKVKPETVTIEDSGAAPPGAAPAAEAKGAQG